MKNQYLKNLKGNYVLTARVLLAGFSIIFMILGIIIGNFNLMLTGSIFIFLSNIVLSLENVKLRIIFLIYNSMIFLFLMGRPILGMIQGISWYSIGTSRDGMIFAVVSVFMLLLSLHVGTIILSKNEDEKFEKAKIEIKKSQSIFEKNIQSVAFIIFIVAFACACLEGYERIAFMRTHTYVEFYTMYTTIQPAIVKAFIQMMLPSMFIYLATMPSKKKSMLVLGCFVISRIPSLIVGMRSPIMLVLLFVFVYFFMRNIYVTEGEKKWLGKKEAIAIIIMIPIAMIFLFSYNYIRNQQEVDLSRFSNPLVGFIYQQGETFDVLAKSYDVIPDLPKVGFPGYFFGPLYDKTTQSLLIRTIFDIPQASGQTKEFLEIAHDSKAHLSHLIMGDGYFAGHGVGTSNILDAYIDFGWAGIGVLGLLMGVYFRNITIWVTKHWLLGASILSTIATAFYSPRANAVEVLGHVFNLYFWFTVAFCVFSAVVITPDKRNKIFGKIKFLLPRHMRV